MVHSKSIRIVAAFALSVSLSGCMFSTGHGGAPLVSVMFITRDPPPARVEVVSARPSADAVWISGHWSARGNNYKWTRGHWQRPQPGTTTWESGKWTRDQRGWYYTEGHWY